MSGETLGGLFALSAGQGAPAAVFRGSGGRLTWLLAFAGPVAVRDRMRDQLLAALRPVVPEAFVPAAGLAVGEVEARAVQRFVLGWGEAGGAATLVACLCGPPVQVLAAARLADDAIGMRVPVAHGRRMGA